MAKLVAQRHNSGGMEWICGDRNVVPVSTPPGSYSERSSMSLPGHGVADLDTRRGVTLYRAFPTIVLNEPSMVALFGRSHWVCLPVVPDSQ